MTFYFKPEYAFCVSFHRDIWKTPFHIDSTTLELLVRKWLQVGKNQTFATICQSFRSPSKNHIGIKVTWKSWSSTLRICGLYWVAQSYQPVSVSHGIFVGLFRGIFFRVDTGQFSRGKQQSWILLNYV